MSEDRKGHADLDRDDHDDIEIIEVVGLNEDAPPPSDEDPEEVEVSFDGAGPARPAGPLAHDGTAATPRSSPSAVAVDDESLKERLLRLQADFENYKKRVDREKGDYQRFATSSLMAKLLPVIDNFERALAAEMRADGEGAFRDGVVLIHRQLMEELKKEGLAPMESVGEPFDPAHHEAVATDASSGLPPNTVVEELQRGYYFRDRLLRPAAVKVSVDAATAEANGEES
jgi:molecular chaperone GrpE (heat shock protein)